MTKEIKPEFRVIRPMSVEHSHGYSDSDNTKKGWLVIRLEGKSQFNSEVVAEFGYSYRFMAEKLCDIYNKRDKL